MDVPTTLARLRALQFAVSDVDESACLVAAQILFCEAERADAEGRHDIAEYLRDRADLWRAGQDVPLEPVPPVTGAETAVATVPSGNPGRVLDW